MVWIKLGITHTAGLGWAQLNPNQMTSRVVMATIVQYNTVPAPAVLCPNQFGLLFLPVSPLPSLSSGPSPQVFLPGFLKCPNLVQVFWYPFAQYNRFITPLEQDGDQGLQSVL